MKKILFTFFILFSSVSLHALDRQPSAYEEPLAKLVGFHEYYQGTTNPQFYLKSDPIKFALSFIGNRKSFTKENLRNPLQLSPSVKEIFLFDNSDISSTILDNSSGDFDDMEDFMEDSEKALKTLIKYFPTNFKGSSKVPILETNDTFVFYVEVDAKTLQKEDDEYKNLRVLLVKVMKYDSYYDDFDTKTLLAYVKYDDGWGAFKNK